MAASAVSNMSVCGSPGITDSHQSECPNYLAKLQTSLKNQMNESYHSVWKSHPELRASNGLWSKFSTEKESGILKTGWLIALSVEVLCHKFDFLSLPEVLRIEGLDMLGMPQGTMTSEGGLNPDESEWQLTTGYTRPRYLVDLNDRTDSSISSHDKTEGILCQGGRGAHTKPCLH